MASDTRNLSRYTRLIIQQDLVAYLADLFWN